MRYLLFTLLLSCYLAYDGGYAQAAELPQSSFEQNLDSKKRDFYTTEQNLVQQQINLIARLKKAISEPDPNQVRAVRGQLTTLMVVVERFLKRHYQVTTLCKLTPDAVKPSAVPDNLTEPQALIYCSLYASSQELSKLAIVLDRLLSRRGELALVRELPLVSGERQSDPVLAIAPVQRPQLDKPAIPFSAPEPNLSVLPPIIGYTAKTAISNYQPPIQPAIAPPESALVILNNASQILARATSAFPPGTKFQDPQETAAALDREAYDLDPQEGRTYAAFLALPKTGIFRVLPSRAYHRPLNTLENRLQKSVSERYPFPSLGETKKGFTPRLALVVNDNFQIVPDAINYNFMVDLGDVPLEKLDNNLQAVSRTTREFFFNYQPPKHLNALQVERQRFLSGRNQNPGMDKLILAEAKAIINHTYLVRSLQFQLPEIILSGKPISPQQRRYLDQLLQMQSSDIILAFRPVRRRSDGSYTVLVRVLNQLPDPQIVDLEDHVKF